MYRGSGVRWAWPSRAGNLGAGGGGRRPLVIATGRHLFHLNRLLKTAAQHKAVRCASSHLSHDVITNLHAVWPVIDDGIHVSATVRLQDMDGWRLLVELLYGEKTGLTVMVRMVRRFLHLSLAGWHRASHSASSGRQGERRAELSDARRA